MMRAYGFKARDAELDTVFDSFDCFNKDGSISLAELITVLRSQAPPVPEKIARLRRSVAPGRQFDQANLITGGELAGIDLKHTTREQAKKGLKRQVREKLAAALEANVGRAMDFYRQLDTDSRCALCSTMMFLT